MTSHTKSTKQAQTSMVLAINRLRLETIIGCLPEEKIAPQTIEITVRLFFDTPPETCKSDNISNTVCYGTLCKAIEKHCTTNTTTDTIEHLSKTLYDLIRQHIPTPTNAWLKVSKLSPPVPNLQGSADCIYSDLPHNIAWSLT